MLSLYLVGESKILNDLIKLGFNEQEILPFLNKVDKKRHGYGYGYYGYYGE